MRVARSHVLVNRHYHSWEFPCEVGKERIVCLPYESLGFKGQLSVVVLLVPYELVRLVERSYSEQIAKGTGIVLPPLLKLLRLTIY